MIYAVILIVLILVIVLIILGNYLKLKEIDENINICSMNINDILNKKKELLDCLLKILDDDKINKMYENYNDSLSMFDKEDVLYNINWEANKYMNNIDNDEKLNDDEIKKLVKELNSFEENLEGLREYYNSNVASYNDYYFKKPFTYIYKLFKLNDERSFKLRKLENYEILKN